MKVEPASIYLRYINTNRPRANNVGSEIREALDERLKTQFVFIQDNEGRIWQWRNSAHGPMFNDFKEFIQFYKSEIIEFHS